MPFYRFVVYSSEPVAEDLGHMELRDDADALSFGRGVIRDLMRTNAKLHAGWTMDIAEDDRAVASFPFNRKESSARRPAG
jgi:hypothetical protein